MTIDKQDLINKIQQTINTLSLLHTELDVTTLFDNKDRLSLRHTELINLDDTVWGVLCQINARSKEL